MNASLNEKLGTVKWGEFKLGDLFEVVSYKKCFDANKVAIIENRGHPYIVRQSTENGRKGNIDEPIKYLNPGNTISFGQERYSSKKNQKYLHLLILTTYVCGSVIQISSIPCKPALAAFLFLSKA